MKKQALFVLIVISFLAACGGKKTDLKDQQKTALSENDIFDKEKVNAFLQNADKEVQQEAKQQFLTGIDQYRNRQQTDSAIMSFRSSLTVYPFAKTYYELGNAYMDVKNYALAIDAYKMAEVLQFDPVSKVLYNLACAYSMKENPDESLKYLQLAIENGYSNIEQIMADEDLSYVRLVDEFHEVVTTSMAGNTSADEVEFSMYKSHFTQASFPYVLDEATSQKVNFEHPISYDYEKFVPGMINAEFSREVGDEYFYTAKISENEKYTALLYAQAGMWAQKPPVHIYLATYEPVKGKLIDIEKIAGMEYYSDSLRTAVIKPDLSVDVKYFIQQWEKNPDDAGYEDNKRTGLTEVAAKTFRIDKNGNIRETQKMMGMLLK